MGSAYKQIEARLETAIHLRFSLPATVPAVLKKAIKKADIVSAYFEATELAGFSTAEAAEFFGRPRGFHAGHFDLSPRPTAEIEQAFINRFNTLETQIHG
jgi:5'-deoxynucleotidase YfbR-like HD superfamily hydrolase